MDYHRAERESEVGWAAVGKTSRERRKSSKRKRKNSPISDSAIYLPIPPDYCLFLKKSSQPMPCPFPIEPSIWDFPLLTKNKKESSPFKVKCL